VGDVLAGHADVVGDLVDVIALLATGQHARATEPVDRRVVSLFGVDVPLVFLDLRGHPFLPALADNAAFLCVGVLALEARAEAVRRIGGSLRRIEI
jgi:uncharacterized protein YbjT (DUF2867 family)